MAGSEDGFAEDEHVEVLTRQYTPKKVKAAEPHPQPQAAIQDSVAKQRSGRSNSAPQIPPNAGTRSTTTPEPSHATPNQEVRPPRSHSVPPTPTSTRFLQGTHRGLPRRRGRPGAIRRRGRPGP